MLYFLVCWVQSPVASGCLPLLISYLPSRYRPAFHFPRRDQFLGLSEAPARLPSFSRARPTSGWVTCKNAPHLTRTVLGTGFGSSQKRLSAVRRPFLHKDRGSRPEFCTSAYSSSVMSRRSACSKTSLCPAALSRQIFPMSPCSHKGRPLFCKVARCLLKWLVLFLINPLVLRLLVNQDFLAESSSCQ